MMRTARGAGLVGVGKSLSPNGDAWIAGGRKGEVGFPEILPHAEKVSIQSTHVAKFRAFGKERGGSEG